jgi:hypothetical protein
MLPSIPPGVTPLLGPAGPQYIMSQPLYQPAFTLNYDDLQYLPRGIHPHMVSGSYGNDGIHAEYAYYISRLCAQPAGYLDLNYATAPQTNLATTGRETLNVPFSSISDGRYTRPDNTTSPVPPTAGAAGASLSQQVRYPLFFLAVRYSDPAETNSIDFLSQNTAPTHQQPHVPMLQTYATAYIYPPYQQYTAPVYQVRELHAKYSVFRNLNIYVCTTACIAGGSYRDRSSARRLD